MGRTLLAILRKVAAYTRAGEALARRQPFGKLRASSLSAVADNPVARCVLALLLFCASLTGLVSVSYADQLANSGVAWGERAQPPIPHTDVNPLGVNIFLEKEVDFEKARRTAQAARDGGFRWVRQGFAWNDIEISAKGVYTDARNPGEPVDAWAKYDRIVALCRENGLEIIARLDSPPVWARMPNDDVETYRKGPPARNEDYGDFAAAVAERYRGKIKYFQIWNEPNLLGEWGGHPVNPEEYTALLKVAYERIKGANPEAVIITAALAPTDANSVANLNDVLYLEGMYRAGAAPYFDILSTMLYGLGHPPHERRTDLKRLNFSRPILLRQIMERFGDVNTPIWISEYAWISLPPGWEEDCKARDPDNPCGQNIWGTSVDEAAQARWTVEGYERVRQEWPWMGVMNVWYLREPDPRPEQPANHFAIMHPDFTPRPAYTAIQAYSRSLPPRPTRLDKPIANSLGFPLLYALFGALTVGSGAFGAVGLGRWAGAALNRPRRRYSDRAREVARNGAVAAGMGLLVLLYYATESQLLILATLGAWGLLAFLKPQVGLAAVAFAIPFFWQPKYLGFQKFPIAETLLVLLFGAVLARKAVALLLPQFAHRLGIAAQSQSSPEGNGRVETASADGGIDFRAWHAVPLQTQHATHVASAPASTERVHDTAPLPPISDNGVVAPTRRTVRPALARIGAHVHQPIMMPEDPSQWDNGQSHAAKKYVDIEVRQQKLEIRSQKLEVLHTQYAIRNPKSKIQNLKSRISAWNREDAFAPPAVALLILGTLSLFTLADPAFAKDSARAYRWVIVEPILFYFLLTEIITSRRGLLRVADFFVAAGVGVALLGLYQFGGGGTTLVVEGVNRVGSVYQHPNNLALYLGRVLPFAACMALFLPWGWRRGIYALATLPLALALLVTFSRGAWVALPLSLAIAVGVGLRWGPGKREGGDEKGIGWKLVPLARRLPVWARVAAVVGLLGVLAVVAAVVLPRLPARFSTLGSGVLRVQLWDSALRMALDHPLTGVGMDQFLNQFQAGYMTDAQKKEEFTAHPHNIFLDYWLSLGILALPLLAWLLARYFEEVVGVARRAASRLGGADPVRRALALGLLASMVDFLAHGLVDNSYFLMDLALIFWMSCGLLQLLRREEAL